MEIIQPDYVAGQLGLILGREEVVEGEPSDRWLVQILSEDAVLSLTRNEFRIVVEQ